MGFLSEPTHWILILLLVLVLFGGRKLPELGKGLGEGLKGFREGLKGATEPTPPVPPSATPAAPATDKAEMEYVTCSRCGNRFENPMGFKVVDYVCRTCQARG
jgi:sec-independent protein translocase protein TatA